MQFFIAVKLTYTPSEILMFDPEPISVYKQTDLNFTEKLRTSQQAPRAGVLSCTTLLGKHSIIQNQFYELPAAWTLVVVVRLQVLNSPEDIEPRTYPGPTGRRPGPRLRGPSRSGGSRGGGRAAQHRSGCQTRPSGPGRPPQSPGPALVKQGYRDSATKFKARPSTVQTGLKGQCL